MTDVSRFIATETDAPDDEAALRFDQELQRVLAEDRSALERDLAEIEARRAAIRALPRISFFHGKDWRTSWTVTEVEWGRNVDAGPAKFEYRHAARIVWRFAFRLNLTLPFIRTR